MVGLCSNTRKGKCKEWNMEGQKNARNRKCKEWKSNEWTGGAMNSRSAI